MVEWWDGTVEWGKVGLMGWRGHGASKGKSYKKYLVVLLTSGLRVTDEGRGLLVTPPPLLTPLSPSSHPFRSYLTEW